MNNPKISIGVPVFNGSAYLREALDSVLAQTFQDFEIVISDNASLDNTQAICEEYCRRDARIRYVRQPENIGILKNFSFVLNEAKGEYFSWLAFDDALAPAYLETMLDYARAHPDVVAVACDIDVVDEGGQRIKIDRLENLREDLDWGSRCAKFFEFPTHNIGFSVYGLMRPEACRLAFNSMPASSNSWVWDTALMARVATLGEVVALPVVLRSYRSHRHSLSNSIAADLTGRAVLQRIYDRFSLRFNLRRDLLVVLFRSRLKPKLKAEILMKALRQYVMFFVNEKKTLPARVFNIVTGARRRIQSGDNGAS